MVIYVVPENLASIMLKMLDKNIVDFKGITLKNYLKSSFPLCEGVKLFEGVCLECKLFCAAGKNLPFWFVVSC